ncbi:MAG: hypothetical protein AAGF15_03400 [Pseudomonadota bacterium]
MATPNDMRVNQRYSGFIDPLRVVAISLFSLICLGLLPTAEAQLRPSKSNEDDRARAAYVVAEDLYAALTLSYEPTVVGRLVREALSLYGEPCSTVEEYQLFRSEDRVFVVKTVCTGMPVYGLTVRRSGVMSVYGGDRMVADIVSDDGPVYVVEGRATSPIVARSVNPYPSAETSPAGAGAGPPRWLLISIVFNVIIILVLVFATWLFLRGSRLSSDPAMEAFSRLSSDEKDHLIEESYEVLPRIYQHPEGVYIARGSRGKRRLFKSLVFAMAYRDFGFKIGEIH